VRRGQKRTEKKIEIPSTNASPATLNLCIKPTILYLQGQKRKRREEKRGHRKGGE
jgi:hypothetical protein